MSSEKKTSKTESRPGDVPPAETPNREGKDKGKDSGEFLKQLPAILTAVATLLGAIITGIVALHSAGLLPFSATATLVPSLTPSSTWTVTPLPITDTALPSDTVTPPASATLTLTPVETETPSSTPPATTVCPWLAYSTLDPSIAIGENCLNDVLSLGISETDKILFYREAGMNIGIFGISKKIAGDKELNVDLTIKGLNAIRFLALVSRREQGYQSSIGFRVIREGQKKLIQLVRYDANGYDTVAAETTELDIWDGKFRLTLRFDGPQVRAYINNAFFGQTQIEFIERYLFLGYQVLSGGANNPYIHLSVNIP